MRIAIEVETCDPETYRYLKKVLIKQLHCRKVGNCSSITQDINTYFRIARKILRDMQFGNVPNIDGLVFDPGIIITLQGPSPSWSNFCHEFGVGETSGISSIEEERKDGAGSGKR